MKAFKLAIVLALIGTQCSACGIRSAQIPHGLYISASAAESIETGPAGIRFRIELEPRDPRSHVDRTYQYEVSPGGLIQTLGTTYGVTGIGQFDWYWDGKQISQVAVHRGGKPIKVFRRPDTWSAGRHKLILDYAAAKTADRQRLGSARTEAAQAALEMVRACLRGRGECDDIFMHEERAPLLRRWAAGLNISRLNVIVERDDRKWLSAVIERPEFPAPVTIDFDVRPGQPIRLSVSEIIVD